MAYSFMGGHIGKRTTKTNKGKRRSWEMKAGTYLGVALAAVVGMVGASGWLTPARASNFSRRAAALSHHNVTKAVDPILTGAGSTPVPAGSTQFFFTETGELSIEFCKDVLVTHADGGVFDMANSGELMVHGEDVALLILDEGNNIIFGTELATGSPNGPLYFGGYAVSSPQSVDIKLSDLGGGATPVALAIAVDGDVTNTDTKSHTASTAVNGIVKLFGCPVL
jgi:hypothetical protein